MVDIVWDQESSVRLCPNKSAQITATSIQRDPQFKEVQCGLLSRSKIGILRWILYSWKGRRVLHQRPDLVQERLSQPMLQPRDVGLLCFADDPRLFHWRVILGTVSTGKDEAEHQGIHVVGSRDSCGYCGSNREGGRHRSVHEWIDGKALPAGVDRALCDLDEDHYPGAMHELERLLMIESAAPHFGDCRMFLGLTPCEPGFCKGLSEKFPQHTGAGTGGRKSFSDGWIYKSSHAWITVGPLGELQMDGSTSLHMVSDGWEFCVDDLLFTEYRGGFALGYMDIKQFVFVKRVAKLEVVPFCPSLKEEVVRRWGLRVPTPLPVQGVVPEENAIDDEEDEVTPHSSLWVIDREVTKAQVVAMDRRILPIWEERASHRFHTGHELLSQAMVEGCATGPSLGPRTVVPRLVDVSKNGVSCRCAFSKSRGVMMGKVRSCDLQRVLDHPIHSQFGFVYNVIQLLV